MRKIKFLFIGLAIFCASSAFAQKPVGGETAIGARIGGNISADLKHYGAYNTSALEFMAGWNFDDKVDGFTVSGLWEKLAPLSGSKQVSAFLGLGPTLTFGDKFYLGASGILGIDWRFKMAPVNLQFDWMPTYYFVGTSHFSAINGAVSIRYIINNKRGRK